MANGISQVTISFDSRPDIKVGQETKSFGLMNVNGQDIVGVDLGNNTFAKLSNRPDGKYDVTLFKGDGKPLDERSVSIQGGHVSRLQDSSGNKLANQAHRHLDTMKTFQFNQGYLNRFESLETVAATPKLSGQALENKGIQDTADLFKINDQINEKIKLLKSLHQPEASDIQELGQLMNERYAVWKEIDKVLEQQEKMPQTNRSDESSSQQIQRSASVDVKELPPIHSAKDAKSAVEELLKTQKEDHQSLGWKDRLGESKAYKSERNMLKSLRDMFDKSATLVQEEQKLQDLLDRRLERESDLLQQKKDLKNQYGLDSKNWPDYAKVKFTQLSKFIKDSQVQTEAVKTQLHQIQITNDFLLMEPILDPSTRTELARHPEALEVFSQMLESRQGEVTVEDNFKFSDSNQNRLNFFDRISTLYASLPTMDAMGYLENLEESGEAPIVLDELSAAYKEMMQESPILDKKIARYVEELEAV
ncbi:hypothetical protein [Algicola sagamiensis]|uniref:hypothetical protein n=1 Tax=Algicola sagamiensis TaxID=163869 RepID=UPI000381D581|nr:hypothetical protein [Algicola sagamiensis]